MLFSLTKLTPNLPFSRNELNLTEIGAFAVKETIYTARYTKYINKAKPRTFDT